MKAFLRENSVLIFSLSLPLVLAFLFSFVQFFSNIRIANPQYPVIFMVGKNNSTIGYNVFIKDNQIHYTYQAPVNEQKNILFYEANKPRVFIYDPVTKTGIELQTQAVNNSNENFNEVLKDVPTGKIITSHESPDGYILETKKLENMNFFLKLFNDYGNSSRFDISLKKDGKRIAIPKINNFQYSYYNQNLFFLGWIDKE